jgi:hypothetical protein
VEAHTHAHLGADLDTANVKPYTLHDIELFPYLTDKPPTDMGDDIRK